MGSNKDGVGCLPRRTTYGAFQRDGEKLLRFYSELHRELVHYFLSVAIDDEPTLFDTDTTLLAVEDLVFTDLARRGFVLDDRRVVSTWT